MGLSVRLSEERAEMSKNSESYLFDFDKFTLSMMK